MIEINATFRHHFLQMAQAQIESPDNISHPLTNSLQQKPAEGRAKFAPAPTAAFDVKASLSDLITVAPPQRRSGTMAEIKRLKINKRDGLKDLLQLPTPRKHRSAEPIAKPRPQSPFSTPDNPSKVCGPCHEQKWSAG